MTILGTWFGLNGIGIVWAGGEAWKEADEVRNPTGWFFWAVAMACGIVFLATALWMVTAFVTGP